ncbi:unnamed protein product [Caenorhabditis sp. 36 PRJEB53466]|nr:unnamed protein product [Caenorhabditis sp. 36 PRJEB53466]
MSHSFFLVFLLALGASPALSVSDKRCGTDLTRIWLDIVFVIDNSQGMNMYQVFDTIMSLFNAKMQIGTGYDDPRSTRVGIVTYNYNATDVADLYKLQSWNDLNSQMQRLKMTPLERTVATYMDRGLNAAVDMINSTAGFRDNYKKMVIIFTSSYGNYRTRPADISKYLKMQGVSVVTVNTGAHSDVASRLKEIASDNMSFAMSDGNVTQEILKAMTDTNCFCPIGWTQYQWPLYNYQNRYGTCIYRPDQTANRETAKQFCHSFSPKAYLVNELDQQKRSFNFEYINNVPKQPVNAFYNGLTNLNGAWFWDQPTNQPLIALDPNSGSPPPRSGCVADMKYSDGTTSWTPVSCSNQFRFLCESPACDTDNYSLEIRGKSETVVESVTICEFLDDLFPNTAILSEDPYEKRNILPFISLIKSDKGKDEKFGNVLKAFDEIEKLLAGEFFTDHMIFPNIQRLFWRAHIFSDSPWNFPGSATYPKLTAWYHTMQNLPEVIQAGQIVTDEINFFDAYIRGSTERFDVGL